LGELIKILVVLVLLIALIAKRVNLNLSILAAAVTMGALAFMGPVEQIIVAGRTLKDPITLKLFGAIYLVLAIGQALGAAGYLKMLVEGLHELLGKRGFATTIPPMMIGLLPMPGGAMLSAPMVRELSDGLDVSPEANTYINYWFRHVWEYFWPLYPGIIIGIALLEIDIREWIPVMAPITPFALAAGFIFAWPMLSSSRSSKGERRKRSGIRRVLKSSWPVALIAVLVVGVQVPFLIALASTFVLLLIASRQGLRESLAILRRALVFRTLFLIFVVVFFKNILDTSGVLAHVSDFMTESGVPWIVPVMFGPFIVGILTGVNQAYVGVSFPFLLPVLMNNPQAYALAYTTGFIGVLLSPVHLCLVLTKDYFNANFKHVYRYLIPSAVFVQLCAMAYLFLRY
jgi:integral membrane protein (TIGR00529 family)